MPTLRTEASEISVALGILGLHPHDALTQPDIRRYFSGTLSWPKYQDFLSEYNRREHLHSRMHRVGTKLRNAEPLFSHVDALRWAGPDRQASTASAPADLIVANTPVSVKADSNVVANPSPHNLIYNLPSGQAFSKNEENWYIEQDFNGFQLLYDFVRRSHPSLSYLPANAIDFEQGASLQDRNLVQSVIRNYSDHERHKFIQIYLSMCHTVAQRSADAFNSRISASLNSKARVAVTEYLMRWFFRLDSVSYLLCGIDADQEFAVRIPSLTQWKSEWLLDSIRAVPDLSRRQSVVNFKLHFIDRNNQRSFTAPFHTELRWSHGRFCGSPEAKLYKDFHWRDLPFFNILV